MIHMIRERSFWAALFGAVIGYAFMHGMMAQPSAIGQASAAQVTTGGTIAGGSREMVRSPTTAESQATGTAPRLIPFQAYLTDTAGRPVDGTTHTLTFNIYDDPTQGSPLWSETHSDVPVTKGLVNVLLGSQPPFAPLPRFDAPRYVGVKVDGGLELVPRQQIIPAIYAADSDRAKQLVNPATLDPAVTVGSNGNVGIGTTAPDRDTLLDVRGTSTYAEFIGVSNSDGGTSISLGAYGTQANMFHFSNPPVSGASTSALASTHDLVLHTGAGKNTYIGAGQDLIMTAVGSTGNVGIGTKNPESKLHVENGGITVTDGSVTINKAISNLPSAQWSDIDVMTDYTSALYIVEVRRSADSPNIRTFLVLFAGGFYGSQAVILGSVTAGESSVPFVNADFRGVSSGINSDNGPFHLQVFPTVGWLGPVTIHCAKIAVGH